MIIKEEQTYPVLLFLIIYPVLYILFSAVRTFRSVQDFTLSTVQSHLS